MALHQPHSREVASPRHYPLRPSGLPNTFSAGLADLAANPSRERWLGSVHQHPSRRQPFRGSVRAAKSSPDWYSELLNVDDTGALSPEVLAAEKKEMSEALFKQEYYCSFYGQVEGSYYAQHFEYLEREKRIA